MKFEIMFDDLTKKVGAILCEKFNISPGEKKWNVFPLSVLRREEDDEDVTNV